MRAGILRNIGFGFVCLGPVVFIIGTLSGIFATEVFTSQALVLTEFSLEPRRRYDASALEALTSTEAELIQSGEVIDQAILRGDLNEVWGRRYAGGQLLKTRETRMILTRMIDVVPVSGTSGLIRIKVFSTSAEEAAGLANLVARVYVDHANFRRDGAAVAAARIVEEAAPSSRHVKPNRPFRTLFSLMLGMVSMGFGGLLLFAGWFWQKSSGGDEPSIPNAKPAQTRPNM